jgi:Flp pilus assembly protein TadB
MTTNQYLWYRIAGRDPDIRAADADRERTAERLRKAHAEGRLDLTEFQERLERCYESKMIGELAELVRDLPRPEQPPDRSGLGWLAPWRSPLPLVPILITLIVVSAALGHHVFWLWIPLVFLVWRMSWWRRRRSLAAARRGWDGWI